MKKDLINETIRLITENEILMEMANIDSKSSGLQVDIWSDHNSKNRNKKDKKPRVKIGSNDFEISVSIEEHPEILASSNNLKQSDKRKIKKAIKYVGRNYDLFLKHYNDDKNEFRDIDLFKALSERGDYRL